MEGDASPWAVGMAVNSAARVMDLEFEAPGVTSAMLSPDSEWVLAGTDEGQVRQWNRQTAELRGSTFELPAPITHVAYSSDGAWVIVGDQDGHVAIREAATGDMVAPEIVHPEPVTWFDLHPEGYSLVVVYGTNSGICQKVIGVR